MVRTVKMTIRGITVLEDGTDNVIGHYNFRQIPDFHVGDKRENFYFTYDGPTGREKHEFKTKEVRCVCVCVRVRVLPVLPADLARARRST
jgi:hypothetical protein